MSEKKEKFTPWKRWKDRNNFENIKMPGIYAIAISDKDLNEGKYELIKEIVYFGMTNSQSGLKGRLKAFDNTIIGKNGHGGALRFVYEHGRKNGQLDKEFIQKLYVSIMPFARERNTKPFSSSDLRLMGEVAKAEYDCFAEYIDKFGVLPQFNDMIRSPKYKAK